MGSLLDSFGTTDDYCKYAAEIGMTHLGISNHGTADDFINFQKSCKKHNITPIFGVEFYLVPDITVKEKGEKRDHILAFAKNEAGLHNILKMITLSNLEGFFFKARIDPGILLNNSEGLVITSGCSASPLRKGYGRELFEKLIEKQKDDIFLEIMPHTHTEQFEVNELCVNLSEKWGVKLIATNDSHYVRKEDAKPHEVLLAIGTNKKWNDPNRWSFNGTDFYLRDRREMIQAFVKQGQLEREVFGEAINNTMLVAKKCSDFTEIKSKQITLPKVKSVGKYEDIDFLEKLCEEEMVKRGFSRDKVYRDRLKEELKLIKEKGFERYFLLLWDLMKWCREQGIMPGPARGSSAGSLVCYLTQITQIDPIKHKLLFSRFLSPDRIDLPDVDADFSDVDRPRIRRRLEELYGKYNVASVSTYSNLRGRGAVRDVSRVFEVPIVEVNKATSVISKKVGDDEDEESSISEAFDSFDEGKKFKEKYPEVAELSVKLEGQYRNRGVHAAALVVSEKDLRSGKRCSLVLDKDKEFVINWDKNTIEYFGLVKLDILGLKMLSVLNKCKQLIKENHGIDIEYIEVPLEDPKYYEELSKGNAVGCFQLGSTNIRKFCRQMGLENFNHLVAAIALYRPGPLGAGFADAFVRRKNGLEEVSYIHPLVEEATKDTYGVIVFQEQVMAILNSLSGMDWATVDKVRKLMAKSKGREALKKYEEDFVSGCIEKGTLREEQAFMLFEELMNFGLYGFNLSHSVSYSYITIWGMFLKIYYPYEFICSLLTYGTDDDDKKDEYIEEAFRMGLDVRSPKVGISKAFEWIIKDNVLYAPFIEIKGVGNKNALNFEKLNKKGFYNKESSPVSKRFVDILDKINAYEDKPMTDEESDFVSQYLGVSLVKNRLYKYKNLIKLLNTKIDISDVKKININQTEEDFKYYFGTITELNLSTRSGKNGQYNVANASFKDMTGDCKISFDPEFYKEKSFEIEHCEDQIIIIRASSPRKAGNLVVFEAWFQEDILQGQLTTLFLGLAESRRFCNSKVANCDLCDLCNKPMLPKQGRYNIMIVNETSLNAEAERTLWREMKRHSFVERDFHNTHFIKCPVKEIKKITRKNVETCSVWLEEEIDNLRPFIILSFGNTGLKFFTEEDSGIMAKNGTTEWNERFGCWVCYCNSPSTTFYGPQNMKDFKTGIENFCEKVKNLGLITF